ncbi:hypothetical protein I3843_10G140900 [Carya illinoinensis]|uniref:Uncharacterized protein n=1 Tax=Carya illinoinensis TaxID=32201 RepID=A0A8T1PEN0_CARIL|nr:uncharacterized protein LOC122279313 [Carya illinoinensis]KAG2685908.1 hypothetical protein I3760_10G148200 [Carya illinoinensis]KAG6640113.1 hypothetical protein CIPAW_10G149400 [Carya illinoinensis]KAG6693075.1 hypothetical protein I3842_10G146500 [Carya illinoinensis]KAG7960760.1 hypothetical protein I3843_10G140900 [Carya illinoinensis]
MEGRKPAASSSSSSSSSSLTDELFGFKESASSSTGIFGSIFAPSSKVLGRDSLHSEVAGRKQDSKNDSWQKKPGADETFKTIDGKSESMPDGDMSSIYQEQRVQPCHLSSSIYYGGQDVYSHPPSTQSSLYKKDGGEDDSGSASRGNWWQGSLYY